jgi:hypothetical protein
MPQDIVQLPPPTMFEVEMNGTSVMLDSDQLLDLVTQPLSWFNFLTLLLGHVQEAEMEAADESGRITKMKVRRLPR